VEVAERRVEKWLFEAVTVDVDLFADQVKGARDVRNASDGCGGRSQRHLCAEESLDSGFCATIVTIKHSDTFTMKPKEFLLLYCD
jgi:hypothetical protein